MKKAFLLLTVCVILVGLRLYAKTDGNYNDIKDKLAANPGSTDLLNQLKTIISQTTNVDDKANLATIYCLGCIYTHQSSEAEKVQAYLIKNHSFNPSVQMIKGMALFDTCSKCDGKGKINATCPKCQGSGVCNGCKGSGKLVVSTVTGGTENRNCPACGGSGTCKECGVSGASVETCPLCRGQGNVFSREKLEITYLALLSPDIQNQNLVQQNEISQNIKACHSPLPSGKTSAMDPYLQKRLEQRKKEFDEAVLYESKKDMSQPQSRYNVLINRLKEDISEQFGGIPASFDGNHKGGRSDKMYDKSGWDEFVRQCKELSECAREKEAARLLAEKALQEERQKKLDAEYAQREQAAELAEKRRKNNWDEFLQQTKSMKKKAIDFRKVLFEPDKFQGEILVSRVQIIDPAPREMYVHPIGVGQNEISISYPDSGFEKALRVRNAVGKHGVVVIEYVVSKMVAGMDSAFSGVPPPYCFRLVDISFE